MNDKGYSFIEVLLSLAIIMMLISLIVALNSQIKYEREKFRERYMIGSFLHDELQNFIRGEEQLLPTASSQIISNKTVFVKFYYEKELIKGCATWKNVKQDEETFCLYGYSE